MSGQQRAAPYSPPEDGFLKRNAGVRCHPMNEMLPIESLFRFFFSLAFISAGAYSLTELLMNLRKIRAMQSWPVSTGQIIESKVVKDWVKIGSIRMSFYRPEIVYRYIVNGREYTGRRISPAEIDTAWQEHAKDKIMQYPIGRTVPVFYDPFWPRDAVLHKELNVFALASHALVSFVILVVGVLLLTA